VCHDRGNDLVGEVGGSQIFEAQMGAMVIMVLEESANEGLLKVSLGFNYAPYLW
jgi:hypothetical protein